MNEHKCSVYQVQNTLFTNQSDTRNCHKMTNCEQFQAKCYVKIAAMLTVASTHVFLIQICQECNVTTGRNPECSKKIFSVGKRVEIL